jgi:malate dehydrogenase
MQDVAILGAGELGGSLAHVLARRDVVRTIRLVDATGQLAAGKALDIMQAAPIERFSTQVTGSTDIIAAGGSTIVVLADRTDGEWHGDEALLLLKQLAGIARQAVLICAGAHQRELIERGVRELKWPRRRLFGSAPEALASAVRALVALEANGSVKDVAVTTLGIPPGQIVVPWADATVGGIAATTVLDEPARRRITARIAPLWPPGAYALATAAAETISILFCGSRRTPTCFVVPEDERRTRAAALPVRLGPAGVLSVQMPPLSGSARVALDNAMEL